MKLKLNAEKTEFVHMRNRRQRSTLHLSIDGEAVELSHSVKSLGVILDENLTFERQINTVCASAFTIYAAFTLLETLLIANPLRSLFVSW